MRKRIGGALIALGAGLWLLGAGAPAAEAVVSVTACQTLNGNESYRLDANLSPGGSSDCLVINGNGTTINLNGHSISGTGAINSDGAGITASSINSTTGLAQNANNVTIVGPGIIHDFAIGIRLGAHALVQDVLVYELQPTFNNGTTDLGLGGITLGNYSKCVECRVHDVHVSEPAAGAWGILIGRGCIVESSIVETSDNGASIGANCKVWDLVVDAPTEVGLYVQAGTEVARSVVSHCHNGPGIKYDCATDGGGVVAAYACQDSSNSVWCNGGITAPSGGVVTDCATNVNGTKYIPTTPADQCFTPD
jgi:hypothetical protein